MPRPLSPKKNSPIHDLVFTPTDLAKEIIDNFPITGTVLEPCRGEGAFYDQFPIECNKLWCELSEGKDFFAFQEPIDWIVTNPPWSKVKEFLAHSMTLANDVVFLITINHLMTKARMRMVFANGFGYKEIYGVKTPAKPWPQSGFQVAAIHLQKGWAGPTTFSGTFG